MAAWLPMIKVVLPFVAPIVQAAIPAFTKRISDRADPVTAQQIAELQDAVRTNNESVRALARAIEEAAQANDRALKRAQALALLAAAAAVVALVLAAAALLR
jgi:hypothetical protein